MIVGLAKEAYAFIVNVNFLTLLFFYNTGVLCTVTHFVDETNESQIVDFIFTVAYQTEPMLNLAGVDNNISISYKL